jgi:uncharacterized protein involved in exopolysaccharide biosynthesis
MTLHPQQPLRQATTPPAAPPAPPSQPSIGSDLLEALRRYWIVVLLFTVALAAAGVVVGGAGTQTYTAQARLNVGGGDLTSQSIPGYAVGVQSLASAYSRAISADAIVTRTAADVHRPAGDVRGSLSASPVPESPLILVEAKGPSEAAAVALANAGAKQLIAYVTERRPAGDAGNAVLKRFRTASARLVAARRELGVIKARLGDRKDLSSAEAQVLEDAQAAVDVAQLQTRTLADQYAQKSDTGDESGVVHVLAAASTAASDRRSTTEKLALAGLIAGFVLGCAVAMLLDRRRRLA